MRVSEETDQTGSRQLQRRRETSPEEHPPAYRETVERVAGVYYAGCRRVAAGINKLKGYLDRD